MSAASADPLLAYRLDDAAGATHATSIVTNATASYDGPRSAAGWSLVDDALRRPADEFTVQIWFLARQGGGRLIGFSSEAHGLSRDYDRHLFLTDDGHVTFGVFPDSVHTLTSPRSYADARWHQATATLSRDGMTLYVDGEQVALDPSVTRAQRFAGHWRIGFDNLDNWGPETPTRRVVDGELAYAAVYAAALTPEQVLTQWQLSVGWDAS